MYKKTIFSIINNRQLIWEMSKRDLKGLTKGAFLGVAWAVINPLIQVATYVIIVSFIFKARVSPNAGPLDYAIYVLSGMIPWQILTKSIQAAPSLIRSNKELVKQIIYPIETLPLTSLMVGSFGSLVSLIIFLSILPFTGHISISLFLLPIPIILLILFILGISWIFSIVGVLIKDLQEVVTVVMGLLVYLSPVVASESMTGSKAWKLIMLNPLAHVVIAFRDIFWGTFHPVSWLIFIIMSLISFLLGGWVITKAKLMINEYI